MTSYLRAKGVHGEGRVGEGRGGERHKVKHRLGSSSGESEYVGEFGFR